MQGGGDRFVGVFEYCGPANPRFATTLKVHRRLAPGDEEIVETEFLPQPSTFADMPMRHVARAAPVEFDRAHATWSGIIARQESDVAQLTESILNSEEPW